MKTAAAVGFWTLIVMAFARPAGAQLSPSATWAATAANAYQVTANLTYLTASNYESKLDIYARRGVTTPQFGSTSPRPLPLSSVRDSV